MKKFLLFVFAAIIVFVCAWAYLIIAAPPKPLTEQEKLADLTQILGRKPNLTGTTPTGNIEYKGKYASFSYPAAAKIYTYRDLGLKQDKSILETFSFDIQNPRLVFNYAVSQNPNIKSVSDIADVRFRQLPSSGYIQTNISAGGKAGLAFEKQGQQAEKSGFFLVDGKDYSISVTGSNTQDVDSLFNQVLGSLKFNP